MGRGGDVVGKGSVLGGKRVMGKAGKRGRVTGGYGGEREGFGWKRGRFKAGKGGEIRVWKGEVMGGERGRIMGCKRGELLWVGKTGGYAG